MICQQKYLQKVVEFVHWYAPVMNTNIEMNKNGPMNLHDSDKSTQNMKIYVDRLSDRTFQAKR